MSRWCNRFLQLLVVMITTGWLSGHDVLGQEMDFRIETDVMLPGESKPIQQTLTLFRGGVVYDFSRATPDQIMVLDSAHERLVLLDAKRQLQTIIDLAGLTSFMDSARNHPDLAMILEDARAVEVDEAAKSIRVGAKLLRYEATLQQPPQPAMAEQFARFADASAYLNAWQKSSPPPFARIELNTAVKSRQAIPSEITRTAVPLAGAAGEQVVKCRLHSNWKLSSDDVARIAEIDGMLVNFSVVSSTEFYAAPAGRSATTVGGTTR